MKYPKIETLYERDKKTFKVIPEQIRRPEFGLVNHWIMTEKIDGMNVRVELYPDGQIMGFGRTDKAQLPEELKSYLTRTFNCDIMYSVFHMDEHGLYPEVTLYGEGYGPKIQKGGYYRNNQAFRLFDVKIGRWWQNFESVREFAKAFKVETVPYIGELHGLPSSLDSLKRIIPWSYVSVQDAGKEGVEAEGIVARTEPLLFTRSGDRLMWKLKFRDF